MGGFTSLGLADDRPGTGDPGFRLSVGSVLRRTFDAWTANLPAFSLVGLVIYSPLLLALGAMAASGSSFPLLQRLLDLVGNLFNLVLTGGVTYGVFLHQRGRRAEVGELLRTGLSRFGTVWATGIMVGILTLLGLCLLVVPGLVVMTRYWVAVPVAVIESPGANASLSRSVTLTEGNRWAIFAILLTLGLSMFVVAVVLAALLGSVGGDALLAAKDGGGVQFNAAGQALLQLLVLPLVCLTAIAPAIVYHDLRVGREGVDVEELLRVFE